jgi:hypothetical protein
MAPIECKPPERLRTTALGSAGFAGETASPSASGVNVAGEIGGGAGYSEPVPQSQADTVVPAGDSGALSSAIDSASNDETIYVSPGTYDNPEASLSANDVTLASNRGATSNDSTTTDGGSPTGSGDGGAPGALLRFDSAIGGAIEVTGSNVRITGLRVRGHDSIWDGEAGSDNENSVGIDQVAGEGMEVDNCEGWGWASIFANCDGDSPAHIHHNSVHDNPGSSMGYGIQAGLENGLTLIEYNYFNRNRHSIAADNQNSGYEARHNVFGPIAYNHSVDQHGPDPAGETLLVHHNTFQATEASAEGTEDAGNKIVRIRGRPRNKAEVYNNWLWTTEKTYAIRQEGENDIGQRGKYTGSEANKEALVDMAIRNNHYGKSKPPANVGAQSGSQSSSPVQQGSFDFEADQAPIA